MRSAYLSRPYRAGGSSSGRTPAFGAGYLGSIPSPPATFHRPTYNSWLHLIGKPKHSVIWKKIAGLSAWDARSHDSRGPLDPRWEVPSRGWDRGAGTPQQPTSRTIDEGAGSRRISWGGFGMSSWFAVNGVTGFDRFPKVPGIRPQTLHFYSIGLRLTRW